MKIRNWMNTSEKKKMIYTFLQALYKQFVSYYFNNSIFSLLSAQILYQIKTLE